MAGLGNVSSAWWSFSMVSLSAVCTSRGPDSWAVGGVGWGGVMLGTKTALTWLNFDSLGESIVEVG